MFTISHDYYGILGVSKEATEEEIKSQYKKLMKEHHPDQYKGLRAKYVELGDEDLLKVFDEKIRQAEEMSKLINEAFETLIDPVKRRQYDDQVYEPAVAKPEIAIQPTKLTFGTLTEGQRKVLFFTVENKGGPVTSVNIDWENTKPDWGELVIEPDPEATFPIKVTVKVDTTGIPSGPKYEKVEVVVDGEVHLIEVYLVVKAIQVASKLVVKVGEPLFRLNIPDIPDEVKFVISIALLAACTVPFGINKGIQLIEKATICESVNVKFGEERLDIWSDWDWFNRSKYVLSLKIQQGGEVYHRSVSHSRQQSLLWGLSAMAVARDGQWIAIEKDLIQEIELTYMDVTDVFTGERWSVSCEDRVLYP